MSIKYYKLFDVLQRRSMKKTELAQVAGVSSVTLAKLGKGESVTVEIIDRICAALNCQPGDIMEYVPDAGEGKNDNKPLPLRKAAREG
jgi:DNA-binding Xre family transcriptional regulator